VIARQPGAQAHTAAAARTASPLVAQTKYLPYGSQLIPLAAILASLDKDGQVAGAQQKLARRYWCGVFGELYGSATETRFSRDLPDVVSWIRGTGPQPRTVDEAQFPPGRLLTQRSLDPSRKPGNPASQ